MTEKTIYNCVTCNDPMPWWDPKMCCSGNQCGCMGQPTEPQICSEECYEIAYGHTWYHGSPISFQQFEIGKQSNSQVPFKDSIALTKNIDLARVFAKGNGHLYTVKFTPKQDTPSKVYFMPILDNDAQGSKCLRVYDATELTIMITEKI